MKLWIQIKAIHSLQWLKFGALSYKTGVLAFRGRDTRALPMWAWIEKSPGEDAATRYCLHDEGRFLTRNQSIWQHDLGLPSSKTEKMNLLEPLSMWYFFGVCVWSPEQTNTKRNSLRAPIQVLSYPSMLKCMRYEKIP